MSIELPNRKVRYVNGRNKSSSNNQGTNKHKGEPDKVRKEAAQAATRANQKVKVLEDGQKIRWVNASEWYGTGDHGRPG